MLISPENVVVDVDKIYIYFQLFYYYSGWPARWPAGLPGGWVDGWRIWKKRQTVWTELGNKTNTNIMTTRIWRIKKTLNIYRKVKIESTGSLLSSIMNNQFVIIPPPHVFFPHPFLQTPFIHLVMYQLYNDTSAYLKFHELL